MVRVIVVRSASGVMAVVVILALAFTTCFGADQYAQGEQDGRYDGANDAGYIEIVWGFLFGVFNVGWVALTKPGDCPPARVLALEGKSWEYKQGYLDGYAQGKQGRRLLYSIGGAAAFYVVFAISLAQ